MKGYLFSLEALIAIIILLFPIIIFSTTPIEFNNEKENIYEGLNLLERENKLIDDSDALKINSIWDLNVSVSKCKDNEIVDYFVVSGTNDFKIISVCY